MKAFIIGSTGLVGSHLLKSAISSKDFTSVTTLSRRKVGGEGDDIDSIVETDGKNWPELIKEKAREIDVFFSAFGTTRAAAGGLAPFKEIDHGINYECAKAAKEAGVDTYVLISSEGANDSSIFPYLKIKGQLEADVINLKFARTIILRPGALIGKRDKPKDWLNRLLATLAEKVYNTPLWLLTLGIYARDVGALAVNFALKPYDKSKNENEVIIVGAKELHQLALQLQKSN